MRLNTANDDRVRMRAAFTLAAGSDGINPVTEQVTLRMSTTSGEFYSANLPPGSFELHGNESPGRWALTDTARQSTGIERFDILLSKKEIVFVNRGTTLPTQNYTNVTVELAIGNDSGTGVATLIEQPAGSGRWRVP